MIGVVLILLLLLLALSIPIAAALGILGLLIDYIYSPLPLIYAMGALAWKVSIDEILFTIPLFILMGELMLRSGIASRMYAAISQWISWLPGGLMHSNIGTSALFSAISGSSLATAATVTTTAIKEVNKYGYNERLFLGTIVASGTLGILIPPSVPMIVYGAMTNTSIPQLYIAAILPGLVLTVFFSMTVIIICGLKREWGGRPVERSWAKRWSTLPDLLPPLIIFVAVIGSIYAGWATATESASVGVLLAFILVAAQRQLTKEVLISTLESTMRTTGMIMLILIAANFLNFVLNSSGIGKQVTSVILSLNMSPLETIFAVVALYFVLGMFLESLTMMIATIPIITPVVLAAGFSPIWFGVLMMLLMETALITPPVGMNLFVVQGVRKRGEIRDVIIGSLPFVITTMAMIAVLIFFPEVALWLPEKFSGR